MDLWNQASLSRAAAMQAYLRYDSRAAVQTALALSAAANERLQRKQPLVRFIAQQCGSGRRKPRRVAPADRDQGALAEEHTGGGKPDA